jgi:hypothetical protein
MKKVEYLLKVEPTENTLVQTSEHYLKYIDFQYPRNKNYIPWEKTEHKRKKTVFLPFHCDLYIYIYT